MGIEEAGKSAGRWPTSTSGERCAFSPTLFLTINLENIFILEDSDLGAYNQGPLF